MSGIHPIFAVGATFAIAILAGACAPASGEAGISPRPSLPTVSATVQDGAPTYLPAPSASFAGSDATPFEDLEPGSLAPGTYVLDYASIGGADAFPTLAFTFSVPEGWDRVEVDGVVWNSSGTRLKFAVADNLYVDPCDPAIGLRDPAVGPLVDDLSGALATVPGWLVTATETGTYHGFLGTRVELRSPADISACGGESRLLHTLGNPGYSLANSSNEHHDLRILDVSGARVVIEAVTTGDASEVAKAGLEAVVDSISIQP